MLLSRRQAVQQEPERDPLRLLGATYHNLPWGYWVYVLFQADGTVFYVGSSENLISRFRDHLYKYKGRFHHYALVTCRSEHQMKTRELFLIDWYQPEENLAGTEEIEELRRQVHQASAGGGLWKALRKERAG
jgi:GIY-YIG catalytic domain